MAKRLPRGKVIKKKDKAKISQTGSTRSLLPPFFGGGGQFPGQGGFPGQPPFGGFPGQGPGPGPGPGGPGGQAGGPPGPPPSFTPSQPSQQLFAVDPGGIRHCRFRYVYIWQTNGAQYWMYLTFVGRNSIAGYRWIGFGPIGSWVYFGLDLNQIRQFQCF